MNPKIMVFISDHEKFEKLKRLKRLMSYPVTFTFFPFSFVGRVLRSTCPGYLDF